MKKTTSLLLMAMLAGSIFTTNAMADAKKGQKYYLKKLKICKKDGLKNGAVFAIKHTRAEWKAILDKNALQSEWTQMCPHGKKKIAKMKPKHIKNLYDFVWKFASDGEVPSCG